jgi:hypothetical protein
VLTRLNQIAGVEGSATNESGMLLRLSLRPDADPAKVAQEARRALSDHGDDRVPVQLNGKTAAAALQQEDWKAHNADAEAESMTPETAKLVGGAGGASWLLAILLACAALALLLLWWRHHRRLADQQTANEKDVKYGRSHMRSMTGTKAQGGRSYRG